MTKLFPLGAAACAALSVACNAPPPIEPPPDLSSAHVFAPAPAAGDPSSNGSSASADDPGASSIGTATSDDAGSLAPPAPAPSAPPAPKPMAEMFVHIHSYQPQWWALWIPSTAPLQNGQKDPPASVLSTAIAGGNWPPPPIFYADSTRGGGYTESDAGSYAGNGEDGGAGNGWSLTSNGQCGSSDTMCYVGEDYSPLIIDFAGRGLSLTVPNAGTRFDIVGTGRKILISWPRDGVATSFLVDDRNHDGKISSIDEMFGNNTVGPDGRTADNGFDALAKYDANHDRMIDARDPVYRELSVWRDDGDAVTERGELVGLEAAGVERISLAYIDQIERADVFGNESRERSVAKLASGGSARIFDVWFVPGFERR
jgi:hypothetical protein